jgi:hypothetical protein
MYLKKQQKVRKMKQPPEIHYFHRKKRSKVIKTIREKNNETIEQ